MDKHRAFWCDTCKELLPLDKAGILEHLQRVHGIRFLKGDKKLVEAEEGQNYYQNTFAWTISKVKLTEMASGPK